MQLISNCNVMNVKNPVRKAGRFLVAVIAVVVIMTAASGCGKQNAEEKALAEKLRNMSDSQMVDYLMKTTTPDSVARFLCRAALNEIPGVTVDTLVMAKIYATEHYKGDDLNKFLDAYEEYPNRLRLAKKLRLWKFDMMEDPMALDYELGLKYVDDIRVGKKNAKEIEEEIEELRRECAKHPEDSASFNRFKKGFSVALLADDGSDVPVEIYAKYSVAPKVSKPSVKSAPRKQEAVPAPQTEEEAKPEESKAEETSPQAVTEE